VRSALDLRACFIRTPYTSNVYLKARCRSLQLERAGARIASFFPPLIQIGPLGIVQSYGLAIRTARAGCAGAIKSAGLVAIAFVCGAGTLVIAAPLGLYVLGLSNIEGRPEPPTDTNHR